MIKRLILPRDIIIITSFIVLYLIIHYSLVNNVLFYKTLLLITFLTSIITSKISQYFSSIWDKKDRFLIYLIILTLFFIFSFSYIMIYRHYTLLTGIDLAIHDSFAFQSAYTDKFAFDFRGINFFADHFSPLLLIYVPLYWIWPSPIILFLVQSCFIGFTAIPIFLLARIYLNNSFLAFAISFTYLFHPFLSEILIYDFHPVVLMPFLFITSIYFFYVKQYKFYFLFIILTLMVQEDISLIVFSIGILLTFKSFKKSHYKIDIDTKVAFTTAFIGLLWGIISLKVVMPIFGGPNRIDFYAHLGSNFKEIITYIIFHPTKIIKNICRLEIINSFILLMFPVFFLPLLKIETFIILILPVLFLNFISISVVQPLLLLHYSCSVMPCVMIASIFSLKKIEKLLKNSFTISIFLITISLLSSFFFARPPDIKFNSNAPQINYSLDSIGNIWPLFLINNKLSQYSERANLFFAIKSFIPEENAVMASESLAPHFTHYKELTLVPDSRYKGDFIIIDLSSIYIGLKEQLEAFFKDISQDNSYFLIFKGVGFYLYVTKEGEEIILNNLKRDFNQTRLKDYFIGIIMKNLSRFEESKRFLLSALNDTITSKEILKDIYFSLGNIFERENNLEKAIKYYNLSLEYKEDAPTYLILGNIYLRAKYNKEAIYNFEKALPLIKDNSQLVDDIKNVIKELNGSLK